MKNNMRAFFFATGVIGSSIMLGLAFNNHYLGLSLLFAYLAILAIFGKEE